MPSRTRVPDRAAWHAAPTGPGPRAVSDAEPVAMPRVGHPGPWRRRPSIVRVRHRLGGLEVRLQPTAVDAG